MSEEWRQRSKQASKEGECKTFKDKITIANAAILDTFQNNMREKILTNNTWLAVIYFLAQFKEFFVHKIEIRW